MSFGPDSSTDVQILPLIDGVMDLALPAVFPTVDADDWRNHTQFLSSDTSLSMPYGGFAVKRSDTDVVLVDVGGGPRFDVPPEAGVLSASGLLPRSMAQIDVTPDAVRTIVLSHLHLDHIGWLAVDSTPYFPNARIVCHEADWLHFGRADAEVDERVQEILAVCKHQFVLWSGPTNTVDGLHLEHTPGHTPGSVIVHVGGAISTILVGDVVHTPAEFLESWEGVADDNPTLARESRRVLAERLMLTGNQAVGPHFPSMAPGILNDAHSHEGRTWHPGCC